MLRKRVAGSKSKGCKFSSIFKIFRGRLQNKEKASLFNKVDKIYPSLSCLPFFSYKAGGIALQLTFINKYSKVYVHAAEFKYYHL